ncbi:hypothetical protein DB31_0275 [Hyalangium minutum]|uniref:Cysteine-rich CPCC domain-containing protein n=2 Tax=Hyalangium minutum TaxID=394096 RepID=A0A085WWF1_9BACT|nr:hypothetical protein DB31_0275 [Hyalangium minutum]
MQRDALIRLIAREFVARRPPHEKLSELDAYWHWDEDSDGWQRLPGSVREEMLRRPDSPPKLWRSTYDAFFEFLEEDARRIVRNEALLEEARVLGVEVDSVEGQPAPAEPCPCCGFRTFLWRGEYDICPVCMWEDDREQDAFSDGPERLARFSSPNHMTRAEYRDAYEAHREEDLRSGDPERLRKYERFLR